MKILSRITGKKFTIVSYHTNDAIYEAEASRLIASLDAFNLDYYIESIPALGDWKTCTDYKATFIRRAIERVNTPIVWLDADATVVKYPILFENLKEVDISAFINHINNLLSGTVYFANNDKVRKMMDNWIIANKKNTVLFEQKILQSTIKKNRNIIFRRLPIGYCQIYNYKVQAKENEKYVLHWQASRRTKHLYETIPEDELEKLINEISLESEREWKSISK